MTQIPSHRSLLLGGTLSAYSHPEAIGAIAAPPRAVARRNSLSMRAILRASQTHTNTKGGPAKTGPP